jgi:hypothetical protein
MSEEIRNDINKVKNFLTENSLTINERTSYSRVASIMRGLVPNVKTFAFLTAENPFGEQADSETNKKANADLEKKLRSMNLGFTKVKGQYGVKENSFFVPNITKEEALMLGKSFSQESIIYGEEKDKENYDGMNFKMIYTDDRFGEVVGERDIFINMDNSEDYYTAVKGRKFQIPFFDDEFLKSKFTHGSGVIDKSYADEATLKTLNEITKRILEENATPKSRWINRGFLNQKISKSIGLIV